MTWTEIISVVLGGSGLVTGLLTWLRYRHKDKAEVRVADAEAVKLLADAQKTRSEADTTVAEAALKLADRLSKDYDEVKKELEKLRDELESTRLKLFKLEVQLDGEKQLADILKKELESLRQKYKTDHNAGFDGNVQTGLGG